MQLADRILALAGLVGVIALGALSACDDGAAAVQSCRVDADCGVAGETCLDGFCVPVVSVDDATDVDADTAARPDSASEDSLAPGDTDADGTIDTIDTIDATDTLDAADADSDVATGCAACTEDELCCDGRCVDPLASPRHCGACGVSCLDGPQVAAASCVDGACRIDACRTDRLDCDGNAANGCEQLSGDVFCGQCGVSCEPGSTCIDGACTCDAPPCDCPAGGQLGDDANCSACGMACAMGQTCVDGQCRCPDGGAVGDDANCAACGAACGAEESCMGGVCVCRSGQLGDDLNCGACGNACPSGSTCAGNACACQSGTLGDDLNCGACGMACPPNTTCRVDPATQASSCGCLQAGAVLCGGVCVDVESDAQHCGGCGNACPMGQVCAFGTCGLMCPANRADCDGNLADGCQEELDANDSCGSECGTRRDCGGFGDECVGNGSTWTCRCDDNRLCRPGERCEGFNDRCECDNGASCTLDEVCCAVPGSDRACVNLDDDPAHCGRCNRACGPNQTCNNGRCE